MPRQNLNVLSEVARGDSTLESAELLLAAGKAADAVSRAYYAAFHSARAARTMRGVASKTILLALSATGCGADRDEPEVVQLTTTVYENQGRVCIESEADGALRVVVEVGCISGSCDRASEPTCSVDVNEKTIEVSSRAVVSRYPGPCTSDCALLEMECRSAPMSSGTYTLTHGEDSASVTLPTDATHALGDGNFLRACE